MSTSEAQLRSEIARLTATINLHKSGQSSSRSGHQPRANTYVNPNYKPPSRTSIRPVAPPIASASSSQPKEVVLGGVAFKSSGRSLVRKGRKFYPLAPAPRRRGSLSPTGNVLDISVPTTAPPDVKKHDSIPRPMSHQYPRKPGHAVPNFAYKARSIPARRGPPRKRNMTLDNTIRPYQSRKVSAKRMKYIDKPCPRFSTTGAPLSSFLPPAEMNAFPLSCIDTTPGTCSRGLTCMYQHDPDKIAVCWNFLQGNCSSTAETCNLSHDPTPERTPLCLHFLNKGRCTREGCPFPHVNVGARTGVCRDFAVLGYCARGLDCDRQHVRECPDFAETGNCSTKGCKLPHVIRASRNRKAPATSSDVSSSTSSGATNPESSMAIVPAEDAQLGDEYISLTFKESDSEDESEADEEDDASDESEATGEASDDAQMYED